MDAEDWFAALFMAVIIFGAPAAARAEVEFLRSLLPLNTDG